jgi:hypothetical protein
LRIKKDHDKYSFQRSQERSSGDTRLPDLIKSKNRQHGSHNNLLAFLNQRNQKESELQNQKRGTISAGLMKNQMHEFGRNLNQESVGKVRTDDSREFYANIS